MFHPFRFIWKQFNGPQITAITQAIYQYLRNQWDTLLDYFNNLSIATANSEHLTIMGLISGLTRPYISVENIKTFFYTDGFFENYMHGFGDLDNLAEKPGGVFSDLVVDSETHRELLPTELYRKLLSDYVQNNGARGGLTLLDNFIYDLWITYRNDTPNYYIDIELNANASARYGDVWIYVGPQTKWGDGVVYVDAIIASFSEYIYAPEPRIFVSYTDYSGD